MSEKGLLPQRRESRPDIAVLDSKIVFLNKENLEKLEGYKAQVEYKHSLLRFGGCCEIHIILTGFSARGAGTLFDSLKGMEKEGICGK